MKTSVVSRTNLRGIAHKLPWYRARTFPWYRAHFHPSNQHYRAISSNRNNRARASFNSLTKAFNATGPVDRLWATPIRALSRKAPTLRHPAYAPALRAGLWRASCPPEAIGVRSAHTESVCGAPRRFGSGKSYPFRPDRPSTQVFKERFGR